MAHYSTSPNVYTIPRVVLSAVANEQQEDANLEPPFVRIRESSEAYLLVDADFALQLSDYSWAINTQQFQLYAPSLRRIALQYATIPWSINNINERNDTLIFYVLGVQHIVQIPQDCYLTVSSLATALVAAMNAASPGFSFTVSNNNRITLSNATIFRLSGGTFMTNGQHVHGLPISATEQLSFTGGWATLLYTRYVEINCPELLQYTKNPSRGNNISAATLIRIYISIVGPHNLVIRVLDPLAWFNWNPLAAVSNMTISITDEFGLEPPGGSPINTAPGLTFITQN